MATTWPDMPLAEAWQPYEPSSSKPWDRMRAAHLLRRAAFGFTAQQLTEAVAAGADETIQRMLNATPTAEYLATVKSLGDAVLAAGEPRALASWWLYRMLHTTAPLRERMTLFWHGHFATSGAKVADARLLMRQHDLLHTHALGEFRALAQGIARDPAMLLYLDSATNRRTHPNENFARELMELFCLGLGNYTERDIQQLARCFTGWEVRHGEFRFNRYQHDKGEKEFLGRRGAFTGEQAVDVVLDQRAAAEFVVKKIVRELVADEPELSAEYCRPLVERFRESEMNIGDLVATVLRSRLLLEDPPRGRKVRSPVEFAVGWLRSVEATTGLSKLAEELGPLGQSLFYPPNVKGWPGGRAWINSTALAGRANLMRRFLQDGNTRFGGGALDQWVARQGWNSAEETVRGLVERWVAVPLPETLVRELTEVFERGGGASGLAHALAMLPEMQVA